MQTRNLCRNQILRISATERIGRQTILFKLQAQQEQTKTKFRKKLQALHIRESNKTRQPDSGCW